MTTLEKRAGLIEETLFTEGALDYSKSEMPRTEFILSQLKEVQREARIAGLEEATEIAENALINNIHVSDDGDFIAGRIRARIEQIKKEE